VAGGQWLGASTVCLLDAVCGRFKYVLISLAHEENHKAKVQSVDVLGLAMSTPSKRHRAVLRSERKMPRNTALKRKKTLRRTPGGWGRTVCRRRDSFQRTELSDSLVAEPSSREQTKSKWCVKRLEFLKSAGDSVADECDDATNDEAPDLLPLQGPPTNIDISTLSRNWVNPRKRRMPFSDRCGAEVAASANDDQPARKRRKLTEPAETPPGSPGVGSLERTLSKQEDTDTIANGEEAGDCEMVDAEDTATRTIQHDD